MITQRIICLLSTFLISLSLASHSYAEDFKVGVIAPLSGPIAAPGIAFKNGFSLFQKENPSCKTNLIFEDGKYDGKTTSTAFQKLTSVDKVDFTLVWGNTPISVIAPIAEKKKAPTLAIAYTPEAKGRSYVTTLGPKTKLLAKRIVDEFKNWDLKNPAVLTVNVGNALEEVNYVKDFWGKDLDVQVISLEEASFQPIINRFKAKK